MGSAILIIIQLIVFLVFAFIAVVFFLQKILKSDTQGAVYRLEHVYQELLAKQKDLTQKIEASEKEFQEKKEAAVHVGEKIKSEAMDEIRDKRDEILKTARAQADEILAKARSSSDDVTRKIQQELSRKMIDSAASLLVGALSPKVLAMLHTVIVKEFLERSKEFDLSSVGPEIEKLTVKSPFPLGKEAIDEISAFVRIKLSRVLTIEEVEDKSLGAGVLLQFGTLLMDGSLTNFIRESAEKAKRDLEYQH